jgi:RNA-directed DNA polymerase
MQESHGKGPASHPDPESCADGRKAGGEALTGAHAGQPWSCAIIQSGVPTPLSEAEGHTEIGATGKPISDPAQSKTLRMRGNSLHGNREIPTLPAADGATGRPEKATSRTSGMHGVGKSDGCIVCAGQRHGQEGLSPSGVRMRDAVSESGGNSSLAEVMALRRAGCPPRGGIRRA